MSCDGWRRATRALALVMLAAALTACGGSDKEDAAGTGDSGGRDTAAAGPDQATKGAAIRDADSRLSAVRQKASEFRIAGCLEIQTSHLAPNPQNLAYASQSSSLIHFAPLITP